MGLRQLVIRPLPSAMDRAFLDQITDLGDRIDTAVVVIGSETSDERELHALRSLARIARTTATADEFSAVVLRSSAGFRRSVPGTVADDARGLLATLNQGSWTNDQRERLHARLRRLLVPRQGELLGELRARVDDIERQLRVQSLYEQAIRRWPEPFDHIVGDDEAEGGRGDRVVAVPGLGNPAEERTRIRELDMIAGYFADTKRPIRLALVAEPGMGKSALAARACRHLAHHYQVVGWLSATDVATWTASVGLLAGRLGLDDPGPDSLWAELARRGPALIAIDDAPEPGDFRVDVPETPGLHILVTSQSVRWRSAAEVIELGPVDVAEATEYLLARTGAHDEHLAGAVADRIGGYPLALEQAAAAIVEGVSLRGWLGRHDADPGYGSAALRDVWELRLDQLRLRHPDAFALLRTLACAGPAPVPADLFAVLADDFPEPTLPFAKDLGRRDAAVAELRLQGLIRTGVDTETYFLHPLLADMLRGKADFDAADTAMRVAAATSRLLDEYDRDDISTWPVAASLASTAIASCRLLFHALDGRERFGEDRRAALAAHGALWSAAGYLHEMGARREAYRARLLGIALWGDEVAASAIRQWTGQFSSSFSDLTVADVVPAAELGMVDGSEARLLVARSINEQVMILADLGVPFALAYARRALELAPANVPSARRIQPVPWATQIRIEILDNLGYAELLSGDHDTAYRTFTRALRLRRKYPHPERDDKYAELLNDRALVDQEKGRAARCAREFARAESIVREVAGPQAAMLDNIANNLAIAEHWLWHLRSARTRLQAGLDRMWDRLDPRETAVVIQQCNTGMIAYDLGETDPGFALVEGSWRILAERLGADDRETLIRLVQLSKLKLYQGDLGAAHQGLSKELGAMPARPDEDSPWSAKYRLLCAWLAGVAALTPQNAYSLSDTVIRAFGDSGIHAAAAWDFRTAHALAGAGAGMIGPEMTDARRAVAVNRIALGDWHPATLLAHARAALLACDLRAESRPLAKTPARRLLLGMDSLTRPGASGFAEDLERAGQPSVDSSRPGWEADRIAHLLEDEIVDLDPGEQLVWAANAGRLAALAGRHDLNVLTEAAKETGILYGPFHPWTLLRRACDAVGQDDHEALRLVLTAPFWI